MSKRISITAAIILMTFGRTAKAGMPAITLTDIGRMRLSTLSFFLVVGLLCAVGIHQIWKILRKDFPRLPELSFRGAVGAVVLWGLMFVVVLTMISGARELMTPEAWEKNGLTYAVRDNQTAGESLTRESLAAEVTRQLNVRMERTSHLQNLAAELQTFRADHGRFPTEQEYRQIPRELRTIPGRIATEYLYRDQNDSDERILVLEPDVFADVQLAAWTNGDVRPMSLSDFRP